VQKLLAIQLLWLLVACDPSQADLPDAVATRPNVLLLVIDTLRTDHMSCYGYSSSTTPALDALAERGVRFDDCTAGASWTMPSMISLMTGRRLLTTIYRIPTEHSLITERFAGAGYRTGAFVANSLLSSQAGFDRGVEDWGVRQVSTQKWRAPAVLSRAEAFLTAEDERPFFLWLHFLDTHTPYESKTPARQRSAREVFDPAEQAAIERAIESAPESERENLRQQVDSLAREVDRYDAALTELDAKIGRLLWSMRQRGQLENTYVVLVSDHGETLFRRPEHPTRLMTMRAYRDGLGEQLRLEDYVKKEHDGHVFQELVRTAFVVAGPGIAAGRVVDAMVSNLDVMPTLLGLSGIAPGVCDGRDLSTQLLGGQPIPDAEWVTSAASNVLSARLAGGSKLVLPSSVWQQRWGDQPALYDLATDPDEQSPRPLDAHGEALRRRLEEAAENDVHRSWDGSRIDGDTLEVLKELGYVR
jgi:arylsulfatase